MKKITVLDRILLLLTGLLAAYQVVAGIDGKPMLALTSYTIAFGVLLVAGLLLIIMGFEILDSPSVAVVSTLIPLGLSLGLVSEHLPEITDLYIVFAVLGFVTVVLTRYFIPGRIAVVVLAFVHGVSGLLIFALPLVTSLRGITPARFAWVGVGGALIGVGGLLLSFLKAGKAILSKKIILTLLPGLLLLMMIAFVVGFTVA